MKRPVRAIYSSVIVINTVSDCFDTIEDGQITQHEKTILRFTPKELPHFIGRQTELNRMQQKFETPSSNGNQCPLRFVLWGMAGVGKTQLAHRYLAEVLQAKVGEKNEEMSEKKLKNKTSSFNTIWLKASTMTDLDNDITRTLSQISTHTEKPRALPANPLDRRSDLKSWLEFDCLQRYSNYILVLDDVREQTFNAAWNLIPAKGAACRVIITTRSRIIAEYFVIGNDAERCYEIKVFDVKTAVEMFHDVSRIVTETKGEETQVIDVVKAVGCLPLAIQIAAHRAKWYGLHDVWKGRHFVSERHLMKVQNIY